MPYLSYMKGSDIVKVLPDTGEEFAIIKTGPLVGNECAIGNDCPGEGYALAQRLQREGRVDMVKHLVEQFTPLTKLFVISNTLEHTASLLGSAWAFLKGVGHAGLLWGGIPLNQQHQQHPIAMR